MAGKAYLSKQEGVVEVRIVLVLIVGLGSVVLLRALGTAGVKRRRKLPVVGAWAVAVIILATALDLLQSVSPRNVGALMVLAMVSGWILSKLGRRGARRASELADQTARAGLAIADDIKVVQPLEVGTQDFAVDESCLAGIADVETEAAGQIAVGAGFATTDADRHASAQLLEAVYEAPGGPAHVRVEATTGAMAEAAVETEVVVETKAAVEAESLVEATPESIHKAKVSRRLLTPVPRGKAAIRKTKTAVERGKTNKAAGTAATDGHKAAADALKLVKRGYGRWAKNDHTGAAKDLEAALEHIGDPKIEAAVRIAAARCCMVSDQGERAADHLREASRIAETLGLDDARSTIQGMLAQLVAG